MAKRILLIESAALSREIMKFLLIEKGFDVVTASDGIEALELAQSEKLDLIITELHTPRLNGLHLISMLRNRQAMSDVPIVALSSYGSGPANAARAVGADWVLLKPVNFRAFVGNLASLLA